MSNLARARTIPRRLAALWVLAGAATVPVGTRAVAVTVLASESRIVEVTVFPDRAEIVREAQVQLVTGASTVEFAGMPAGVDAGSVRVTAEGVPASLGAVQIQVRVEEPRESAELRAARDEVLRLEQAIAGVDAEGRVDVELRSFLTSVRSAASKNESERLDDARADPEAITGLYLLLRDRFQELSRSELERASQRKRQTEQLELAHARLATFGPASGIQSRVATVEVDAARAGSLTLRVAYLAPGASWTSSYRASLDADTGEVHLVSEGVVRQITGEDWADVVLRLSTASPQRGVEPPLLPSWLVGPAVITAGAGVEFGRAQGGFAKIQKVPFTGDLPAPAEAESSAVLETEVAHSAYNVAFVVPGLSDVAADGRDYRVVLRTEKLPGRISYRAVPSVAPRAYLTSLTRSPADYPLLAGVVSVFAGGAYLGAFPLEEVGPGAEMTWPFGVDNRIEIVRVPRPRSAGREGLSGKTVEIDFGVKTRIHNLRDKPVTLVLEDRIPVAEDERIQIELGKETTPGHVDSARRPGVLLWTLELAPGDETEVVLTYSVRYPRDLPVMGL